MVIHPEDHLVRVGSMLRDRRVLEIGCGDGYRSQQLAKFCNHLVGIDPDAASIEEARRSDSSCSIELARIGRESTVSGG